MSSDVHRRIAADLNDLGIRGVADELVFDDGGGKAIRHIFDLRCVCWRKLAGNRCPVWFHERKVLSVSIQTEVCVQLEAGLVPVFARRVHDHRFVRRQLN